MKKTITLRIEESLLNNLDQLISDCNDRIDRDYFTGNYEAVENYRYIRRYMNRSDLIESVLYERMLLLSGELKRVNSDIDNDMEERS